MTVTTIEPAAARPAREPSIARRILRDAMAMNQFRIGCALTLLLVLAALIYPELAGVDPVKLNVTARFQPPVLIGNWTWTHLLGTDQLGRDMLVRTLIGLRYSLLIGVVSVAVMFVVGCALGLVAGFKGGWIDAVVMRIADAQLSIPMIILAISILGVSRPTVPLIIIVLGLSGWPMYARVARSAAVMERSREYVRGLRVIGASDLRIIARLIAPMVLPSIALVAVLDLARMMIFESILGFLGLGVQPPTPTFGNIIADARKYLINAWWIATIPGLFLAMVLIGINLIGASLETARDRVFRGQR